ncbi:hypothetical protein GGTG_12978 [Gaeumannomyces tritici R3-111a-1]|uniref:Uncharacterized protein n=1 Tax=Gaeumannomyces tritici (strain R3-111a-1) TaxID=644352 RepID=J3PHJ8_GAET3|nr:hypothetical protein GGTG_12978 [Gaeumannomyces tritici R3-111a-1]EJT69359.1 hypothetical protein GGTG_12978 [Gaeumannomyces tritici R3-111a-1]
MPAGTADCSSRLAHATWRFIARPVICHVGIKLMIVPPDGWLALLDGRSLKKLSGGMGRAPCLQTGQRTIRHGTAQRT